MGQRANLLIVTGGAYELYYTHHRANTLDHDLFWGPEYALGFIRAQRRLNPPEWLDDVWAEGGAVLDLDRRVLLWFGGEDLLFEVALRREHAKLMAHVWAGWTVRWANGGIVDMADYVGHPRAAVTSAEKGGPSKALTVADALRTGDARSSDTIASVRSRSGRMRAALLLMGCQEILSLGEIIVGAAEVAPGWTTELATDWSDDRRQLGGFHVDVPARTVDFWSADTLGESEVQRWVRDQWPGWSVTFHGDRLESQLERASGHVRIDLPDRSVLVNRLRRLLLRPDDVGRPSGAESAVAFAQRLAGKGDMAKVSINPAALYDAQLSIPLEVRTRLFDAAVAATA